MSAAIEVAGSENETGLAGKAGCVVPGVFDSRIKRMETFESGSTSRSSRTAYNQANNVTVLRDGD